MPSLYTFKSFNPKVTILGDPEQMLSRNGPKSHKI